MAFVEKFYECFQTLGFLAEIAGGTDQLFELAEWHAANAADGEESSSSQVGQGVFDIGPRGILREVGAHDDFKWRFAGPPVLGPPGAVKGLEVGANVIVGLHRHVLRLLRSFLSPLQG